MKASTKRGPNSLSANAASRKRGASSVSAKPPRTRPAATQVPPQATPSKGKVGAIVTLLRRPEGATLQELMSATGWQAHSVRGAIAGAIKKKLGLAVTSEPGADGRTYRLGADQ